MPKIINDDPITIKKYNALKNLSKNIFAGTHFDHNLISTAYVEKAKRFITKGAKIVNPEVFASYWEHIFIAPELGRRIAGKAKDKLNINPAEIEMLLWLHDVGRLITPSAYFRNDLIGNRLLLEAGLPKEMVNELPSTGKLLVLADEIQLTQGQLSFDEAFTPEQEEMLESYFESLTPTQRIINLADNLGKRDKDGIFTSDKFLTYLKTQETRYASDSPWASIHWATERRSESAVISYRLVEKTIAWLGNLGVDVGKILDELNDYGPKFVLIVRHGELDNPTNIVYNRDSVMDEPIHLSNIGTKQMHKLSELINSRGFNLVKIFTSPETRTQESTRELNSKFGLPIQVSEDLDDVYAPDPYNQSWKMNKLMDIEGNVYDLPNTEKPESVTQRMCRIFDSTADSLRVGQAVILVSHGDPIAFLINSLIENLVPNPKILREKNYPNKGQATLAVIGPDGKILCTYFLNESTEEKSY
jgi:broad specificity phosphatase PhoE